ncbi:hypothetical protein O181_019414 [Austropuccinia psidii MF-1]|uniref:Cdc23 domain-containing protein n=1 Tax=Austropuccinia psidii MF-1 TaxID=1389203 RepID=A0A9Q3C716_9BASI|nr:hypothetical protein [Austropuccinia psidii MF-1]
MRSLVSKFESAIGPCVWFSELPAVSPSRPPSFRLLGFLPSPPSNNQSRICDLSFFFPSRKLAPSSNMADLFAFGAAICRSPQQARSALRGAIPALSSRGLLAASKWAAELLVSVRPSSDSDDLSSRQGVDDQEHYQTAQPISLDPGPSQPQRSAPVAQESEKLHIQTDLLESMSDTYLVGKAYFDVREYDRAVIALQSVKHGPGRFLGLYSRFLAIEKRLNDVSGLALASQDHQRKFTTKHQALLRDLQPSSDPFDLYLKSILLSRGGYRLEAIDALVHSINLYQHNWSAWKFLQKLIEGADELETVIPKLPRDGFMSRFFFVHATLETHTTGSGDSLSKVVEELKELFPSSLFLKSQQALVAYHLRDFDTAEAIFDSIYQEDPFRVEDVDTYSNILYVMEKRAKLTTLAQHYVGGVDSPGGDRMRPEVCCLLGNYWSLSGEHEKAIIEFRRALRLDPGYLSAWTLMGHEYVELKNTYAAIESYRRAIDANSKDYRAWYGLGQTYEVLDMLSYSLHYYQQATALKPYDTRMWLALAQIYEKLGRRKEARMATKRALMNAQPHGGFGGQEDFAMLLKLAELYDADGRPEEAAKYHKKFIDESLELEGGPTVSLAKSLLYLAKYETKINGATGGDFSSAKEYLSTLIRMNVDEKEDAQNLLRKLQSIDRQPAPELERAAAASNWSGT